jgi:adenosine deaminase
MQTDFAHLRQQLLDAGLRNTCPPCVRSSMKASAAAASWSIAAQAEQRRPAISRCASSTRCCAPCLPQAVFVQLVCGFELASADPLVVGINMVQPEDGRVAMANYRLQMQMVHALHALYPKVHITLHAGELAPGMVPPDGLALSYPLRGRRGRMPNASATAST